MKSLILLFLTLLITASLFSQKWVHTIGVPNVNEESQRVIELYDRGYLITGLITPGNNTHGLLIKTDINGNVLWNKVIGALDQVLIVKTVYDEEGNLYVFGLNDQQIDPLWPLVLKLNACGELQWCIILYFDEFMYGYITDAILLGNGDLIALAYLADEDYSDQIFLFCISPEGECKWKKSYASCSNYPNFKERLGSRIQFFDDIYIISGYVYSPHPDFPNILSLRPMFIGIDTLFNEKFVLPYALVDNLKGKAYDCISVNDSILMGVGTKRFDEGGQQINNSAVMFFNKNGIEQGYHIIENGDISPSINSNFIYDIERINDSLFIATSAFGEDYEGNPWGEFIIDTSGNVLQYESREGTAASSHIFKTFDNKYVIASSYLYPDLSYDVYLYKVNNSLEQDTVYPGNFTYDSLCPYPIQSGVIDLTGCGIITGISDIPWLEEYNKSKDKLEILAYPNPANDGQITIEFKNTQFRQNMELKCYNVYGVLMCRQQLEQSQSETTLNIVNWPAGIYLINLFESQKLMASGKFVKK
jgi:hypothetical protein